MKRLWIILVAIALAVLVAAPSATAAKHGTDRPVRAELSGVLTWEFDWADPLCPVTTVTEASGVMSHLGRVASVWRHCPQEAEPYYTNGRVTFTAANGDTLMGEYVDVDGEAPFSITVVGGTGRFAQATGTLSLDRFDAIGEWDDEIGLPIEPWTWDGTLTGSLSY